MNWKMYKEDFYDDITNGMYFPPTPLAFFDMMFHAHRYDTTLSFKPALALSVFAWRLRRMKY